MIDEKLGQIMDLLRSKGLCENSIIVYTSDHGDHLFDHGLYYKGELYDTIVNVPLMVKAPDELEPGRRVGDPVSQMDLVQYFLGQAGVESGDLNGVSLAPVIEKGEEHARQYVFAEEGATGLRPEPEFLSMIRSRRHKLIYFAGNRTGQLFDLASDPGETTNLWGEAAHRGLRDELTGELLNWLSSDLYKHRALFSDAR